jgi:hypothetical protein
MQGTRQRDTAAPEKAAIIPQRAHYDTREPGLTIAPGLFGVNPI